MISSPPAQAESAPGPAAKSGPAVPEVKAADWTAVPSFEDFQRFYPRLAELLEIDGKVALTCKARVSLVLEDCVVEEETPVGMGFGRGALGLSTSFRIKPPTRDGKPVDGATVRVPIVFRIERDPGPASFGPKPDAKSLALARRLVAAMEMSRASYGVLHQRALEAARKDEELQGAKLTGQQTVAYASFEIAMEAASAVYTERLAERLTMVFSAKQLQQLVAFHESPVAKAWRDSLGNFNELDGFASLEADGVVRTEARAAFCATVGCLPERTSPAAAPRP